MYGLENFSRSILFDEEFESALRLLLGGAYFWGGAYYRSLISNLQQMRLLLGGAYYRGALIIGSLRYVFTLYQQWHLLSII